MLSSFILPGAFLMRFVIPLALLLLLPAPAARAQDIWLQWDDCSSAGVGLRTFACNTNAGAEVLVASFTTNLPAAQVGGIEGVIEVFFPTASVPSWWTFGGCRTTPSLQLSNFIAGPSNCVSPWPVSMAGGVFWQPFLNRGRIRAVAAVPTTDYFPLSANVEYYAYKILLTHLRSAGTGSCSGCDIPAGLYFTYMKIATPTGGADDQILNSSFDTRDDHRHFASWQCDGAPEFEWDRNVIVNWVIGPGCTVSARRPTWGSIQSLYR